jgi:hypothetical protein
MPLSSLGRCGIGLWSFHIYAPIRSIYEVYVHVVQQKLLQTFRHLLRPLIRVLLRNGVTWAEFAELGKELFVEVAREDYGIQGRPTNSARVALMTGLNRHEVTRIKKVLTGSRNRVEPPPSRISQVLSAWHVDPRFLGADGLPRVLPATGPGPSVATLLAAYAGGIPHGAVLKELEQLGLVEETPSGFRVRAREYVRSAADPDQLRQAGIALHDHAATIAHNLDTTRAEPPRFERMATQMSLPQRHVRAFRALVEAEGNAFLRTIDAWLTARSEHPPTRGRTVRTGVGVFLIHDEKRGEQQ